MHKRAIFENYLKYAGRCISYADSNALKEYGEYYFLALMHAPVEIQLGMASVHKYMSTYKWGDATSSLEKLIPKIISMLQES